MEQVLEARVGDEGGARTFPFQQSVRRDRRPVGEPLHVACADGARGRDDRLLLALRREHLCSGYAAAVEQHRICERPADVDAEDGHSGRLTP